MDGVCGCFVSIPWCYYVLNCLLDWPGKVIAILHSMGLGGCDSQLRWCPGLCGRCGAGFGVGEDISH